MVIGTNVEETVGVLQFAFNSRNVLMGTWSAFHGPSARRGVHSAARHVPRGNHSRPRERAFPRIRARRGARRRATVLVGRARVPSGRSSRLADIAFSTRCPPSRRAPSRRKRSRSLAGRVARGRVGRSVIPRDGRAEFRRALALTGNRVLVHQVRGIIDVRLSHIIHALRACL